MRRLLALAVLLSACGHTPEAARPLLPTSRQEERAELVARLRRDLVKVDRSINVTEKLISASRSAPYLPDLLFRLAELYVEKSRYRFHLERELQAESGRGGSLVVPEVTLLKQKAVSLHERLIREYPDFQELDKVRFFAAHEYRELGQYEEAMRTLNELARKHPKSPLVPEALLIIADYHFDQSKLDLAESYYLKVTAHPTSPAYALARYKLGWVWINRGKHGEAVKHFEAAARAASDSGEKGLSVRSLALSDLVYSYTESRSAKGAVEYFEELSDSANTFEVVLEKLGNRYFIKQEFENAAPVYRRLLLLARDFERDPERAARLYETIKASKGKVVPRADDVRGLVRVASRTRVDPRLSDEDRADLLADLEVYTRDLATSIHIEAQKKNDKALYSEAADAYGAYLELFRAEKHVLAMMKNRAEALFAAERFDEAGRQYERVARRSEGAAREQALYSALVSFQSALKNPDALSHFARADARAAMRLLGAEYVKTYPASAHTPTVKFNIARSCYDEGLLAQAGEMFAAFAAAYPNSPDAVPAAHLALDSFHALKDYKALGETAQKLLAVTALPAKLRDEIRAILTSSRTEELAEAVIAADPTGGDAVQRLLRIADDSSRGSGDLAERALNTALGHAMTQRDVAQAEQVAKKILERFPKTASAANAMLTLARIAVETADFDAAVQRYESLHAELGNDAKALEALETASTLRLLLGEPARAAANLEKVAAATRGGAAWAKLAEARLQAGDLAGAVQAAQQALRADPGAALAAAVLGEALLAQNKAEEAELALLAAGPGLQRAMSSDPHVLAKVYFLWGESMYRQFAELGPDQLERKAALLQGLQQAYTSAAQLGGSWAIAGLYRMGRSLAMLSETLLQVPDPPGLKKRERAQLKATLKKQAAELKEGSAQAFEACVKKARELEVYTPFAQGCLTRREVAAATPVALPPPGRPLADQIGPLREALSKNPSDVVALEKLGRLWLEADDLRRARLTFARAVEIDENRAPAHAALGYLHARLGEPELAYVELSKALELDGRDEKSRANLAALKCRFGDPEGARAELKKIKSTPQGLDVDPGWAACRK